MAAFPNMNGKILNLRDLEQGLDQINRLARYNAQIKILPGSEQGFSIVDIQTVDGRFWGAGIGFNNGGQDSTGETQLSLNVSAENVFWLLDRWSLNASKSSEFANDFDSENMNFALSIPFGYWNLDYRTSYSTYLTHFENYGFIYDSNGKTNNHNVDLKWLFKRNSIGKSSLKLSICGRKSHGSRTINFPIERSHTTQYSACVLTSVKCPVHN